MINILYPPPPPYYNNITSLCSKVTDVCLKNRVVLECGPKVRQANPIYYKSQPFRCTIAAL